MTCRFASLAALACLMAFSQPTDAASRRGTAQVESNDARAAGEPMLAIVSLRSQRITVYDAQGWILRAPVSSGIKGRETPAGVFSVIEKDADHRSNLYDDAWMPHMQRITWSGIALHGGPLPGYPASHGCVRLPYGFAERLFGQTRMGMRVIIAPGDVAPAEIAHPTLFRPKPGSRDLAGARKAEAEEATRAADQARLAAVSASREAAKAMVPVRKAENLKHRAEEQLVRAEAALASAASPDDKARAEALKASLIARIAELDAQAAAAKTEVQPKLDAVMPARQVAVAAEAARVAAVEAAQNVSRELEPVSVFISRSSQRLYVRRAFLPILETEITIRDADQSIGTHVFTALERTDREDDLRWSVVSVAGDSGGAKAALDRIVIPADALERIGEMASPRSSLIISDEPLSKETGNGTDFVVLLSGEPQGSLKIRTRSTGSEARYWRF
jgi:hypothetical protein